MSIEELVNRAYATWAHDLGTSWTDAMRAALTEQAEAYEQRIRDLQLDLLVREVEAQRVPEGWIQVSERLPEQDVSFLAVTDCAGDIHISTMRLPVLISKNSKPDGDFIRERVTHWMPLPAAPASTAPRTIRIGDIDVPEPEPLTCDECGAATDDPWHSSESGSRHFHRCDACHTAALEAQRVPEGWQVCPFCGRRPNSCEECLLAAPAPKEGE